MTVEGIRRQLAGDRLRIVQYGETRAGGSCSVGPQIGVTAVAFSTDFRRAS